MNNRLLNDLENLDEILDNAKQVSGEYLANLNNTRTSTKLNLVDSDIIPRDGLGALKTIELFKEKYSNLIVSSSGPRFWGYVTGGSTPASIVGDWLATVYDQNTQAISGHGDISANIELQTIDMLLDLFNLKSGDFFGGFVTGATMSGFTCLAVARQWVGRELNVDIAKKGLNQAIPVLSATPHSSAVKALSMLGMGSDNIIRIKTIEGDREALCIHDLENQLKKLEGKPSILISSGGTVNTVDFDDFTQISKLKEKYNFWWHIDAAFGGFVSCSKNYSHLIQGWEQSDSITIDCHKWMNVPYESAVFFIKKKYSISQIETFQNSNAPYLGDPFDNFNYLNMIPENSRRLKALPTWFSLMAYGKEGYQSIVDNCIELAQDLGQRIDADSSFKLLAPVRLNNICFTLNKFNADSEVTDFLYNLNETGIVFMTPTKYNGIAGIRCSLVNWRTSEKDIDLVYAEMVKQIAKKPAANK